jgi:signal peptidase I
LEKFVSYNYLFTFSSLSNEQVNFPETSYRMGGAGIGKIILSSGGRFSENRVSTAYVTDDNPAGKYDYFIDEVVLNHLLAPTNEAKATTVTNFSFEVTEPYIFAGNKPSELEFDVTVPKGKLWVMGDHRGASADSRYHQEDINKGFIPVSKVTGRVVAVIWPFKNITYVPKVDVLKK